MSARTEALEQARMTLRVAAAYLAYVAKAPCMSAACLAQANDIDAALSLPDPSAAPVVPQWLPIESAPKDGAEFLGWTRKVRALILYWDGERWSDGMSRFERSPSHWMPLPPAPQQGERAGQEGEQG